LKPAGKKRNNMQRISQTQQTVFGGGKLSNTQRWGEVRKKTRVRGETGGDLRKEKGHKKKDLSMKKGKKKNLSQVQRKKMREKG